MYETAGTIPVDAIPGGASLLCLGPPMSGKEELLVRFLAAGLRRDEAAVVVSTDVGATDLFARYPDLDDESVRVIDCAGESAATDDDRVRTVNSPADLTGVGIQFSETVGALEREGYDRIRVGVGSITTFGVYSDSERLFRFLHAFTDRLRSTNAAGLFLAHSRAFADEQLDVLLPLFDGRVQVRSTDDGAVEMRVSGVADAPDDWVRFEGGAAVPSTGTVPGETPPIAPEVPDSIGDLLDTVSKQRLTLTLCNFDDAEVVADLEEAFARLNTDVRTASIDVPTPEGFAVLHRDDDFLAAEPVRRVHDTVTLTGGGVDLFDKVRISAVFAEANRVTYGIEHGERPELRRISRLFEMGAWRNGAGELHAGFQSLSRLHADPETATLYERLAEAGVDVHVYGQPDGVDVEGVTVHEVDTEETRNHWFVVYDGAGNPDEMGALVARHLENGNFRGFWSFRPELVTGLLEYLHETYGQSLRTT